MKDNNITAQNKVSASTASRRAEQSKQGQTDKPGLGKLCWMICTQVLLVLKLKTQMLLLLLLKIKTQVLLLKLKTQVLLVLKLKTQVLLVLKLKTQVLLVILLLKTSTAVK